MAYRNTSWSLLLFLILIVLTACPIVYIVTGPRYYFVAYFIPLLVIEILAVLKKVGSTNRAIDYFFESIENDDISLRFNVDNKNRNLRKIHEKMNKVNEAIREMRLKNIVAEKFYLNLAQHSATGLVALNPVGNVIFMNPKAYDYAGMPYHMPMEMLKNKNATLFSTMMRIRGGETVLAKLKTEESLVFLSIRAAEMKTEEGIFKLISLQDIRRELDENELDSWIKLLRILSHEIMNSVAPVTSLSDTLKRFFKKGNKPVDITEIDSHVINNTLEGLEVIEERGKGLLQFVTNFRKLTHIPQPDIKPVNIESWINSIKVLVREQLAGFNVSLDITFNTNLGTVLIDENLMTQVILNILKNATDALTSRINNRKIMIGVYREANMQTTIKISNNGEPLPAEMFEKIFVPFFTTKKSGTGIGLSLSQQIVRLHGGQIRVESTRELTSFIITL